MRSKILRAKNKFFIECFPFLHPRDYFGNPLTTPEFDYSYNELEDSIPEGWWKRFGLAWCRDLKECCEKEGIDCANVIILEAKEKYGGLRIYLANEPECWFEHEYAWEYISEHTCVQCGDFPCTERTVGWISPFCSNCAKDLNYTNTEKIPPLKEFISYSTYNKDGKRTEHLIDMKPYYDKIGYNFVRGEKYV